MKNRHDAARGAVVNPRPQAAALVLAVLPLLLLSGVALAQSDATLSSLVPSAGTLRPSFASSSFNYTAGVAEATTSLTVTPTATDGNATITVNGNPVASGNPSAAISLSVGANVITTVVVSADTTATETYTLTVTRAACNTLTWDANGTEAGQTDGTGTWLNASRWWDGSVNLDWVAGLDAEFGNGGTGGTITVGTVSADSVTLNNFTGTYTLSGGSLTVGTGLSVGASAGAVAISTPLSGAGGITMNGANLLTLSGANTYSGATTVNGGVVRLSNSSALPGGIGASGGTSALTLNGGVVELANGDFLRNLGTGIDQFQIAGGASGFSAGGNAARTINIGNNPANELVWGSATFNPSTLVLNQTGATKALTLTNAIDLAGADRTIAVNANTATLSGVIQSSSGTAGLIKDGAGTLVLSGANTYNGGTVLNAGGLTISSDTHLGAAGGGITVNGNATFTVGQPSFSSGRSIAINNSATLSFGRADGTATFNGDLTGTGGIAMVSSSTTQLIFNGTGNTFEGRIAIGGDGTGTKDYRFAFASLADSVTANGRIVFSASSVTRPNGSVFEYTGSANLVLNNRQIELASVLANPTNGHQIRSNGVGTLTVNTDLIVSTAVAQTLALRGSGTGIGTFAGVISNGSSSAISLTKGDAGTWVLSGANTYTGPTTISAGTLIINGDQSAAAGAVAVNGTSTLGGSGTIGGSVTVAAGARIAPGTSVGTLTINGELDISLMAGGAGTLNFELDPIAASDRIAVGGTLTIGGEALGVNDFAFSNLGGLGNGVYKLITSSAPVSGTLDAANLTGTIGEFECELRITGNDLELVVGGGVGVDYDVWAAKFAPANLSNPEADYDGDGLSNDCERIFGLNPANPASVNPISVPLDPAAGTFGFTRRDPALSGLVYSVWTSTDLVAWTEDKGAVLTPGAVVDEIQPVAVQLSAGLLAEPKLFLRLAAVEPEPPPPPPPLLEAAFEDNDGGFTVLTAGGTPWAWGAPNSPTQGGGAVTAGAGGSAKCWGTNLTGGYLANTDTSLRSPVIDLTAVAGASLSFARSIDANTGHTLAVNVIEAATDTVIANVIPAAGDPNNNESPWQKIGPVALPAEAIGKPVRIEWRFTGDGDGTYNGVYIDNVVITP